eukprot:m.200489 g.200489  ORF g.200489 m.200489 type:complete len:242 (+) comp18405_c1_seq1:318-1043(+)
MCRLLDTWGVIVQGTLGLVAFCTLVIKWRIEVPRRSLTIWFFDSSKQGFAATIVHLANLWLSRLLMSKKDNDPCTWFFVNVILDSTVGLLLVFLLIRLTDKIIYRKRWTILTSGEYGTPPSKLAWAAQCTLYCSIVVVEKVLVSLLLLFPFWQEVGQLVRNSLGAVSPKLEVVLTMFIVPFLINAIWFWVVDSIIMKDKPTRYSLVPGESAYGGPGHDIALEDLGSESGSVAVSDDSDCLE